MSRPHETSDPGINGARELARGVVAQGARLADRMARLDRLVDRQDCLAGEIAQEASAIATLATDLASTAAAIRRRVAIDRNTCGPRASSPHPTSTVRPGA